MPNIVGTGQLGLVDLNDAIISGVAPSNPSIGTLWLDNSTSPKTLKEWDGTNWIVKGEIMDEGTGETITDIQETLGNMANDNKLDVQERQVIKDKLTEILGYVIADTATTLPTTATLDGSLKGGFYTVRKSALNAGILSSDAKYTAVVTQYNNLKTYLETMTPKPWDISNATLVIDVVKATFRDKWLQYYLAVDALATATAQKLKENVDNVSVGGTNYARNGDFSIPMDKSLWLSYYIGSVKEIVDISSETPPHQYALHISNTTATNGGILQPVLWSGAEAEAMLNKEITIQFWLKYNNIVQGANSWNKGNFGVLIIEGETSTGTKVYSYPSVLGSVVGTNTTWQKQVGTIKITLPSSAVKITNISFKHILEGCTGEFWTTGLKIEIGNKATDWSQSPHDIQARMVNVEFKVQDDQIISKVTSSEKFNLALTAKADGKGFDFENGAMGWKQDQDGTTDLTGVTEVVDGSYGAKSIQITGGKWVYFGKKIPVNVNNVYKIKFRAKQTVDATTVGTSKVYAGVACFDANGNKLTASSFGTHRYSAVVAYDLTVADGWKEFVGEMTGEGDEGYGQFIVGTKYAVPMFIVNYNNGDGTTIVDTCSIEDITELNTLGQRVQTVEQKVDKDGITTVIESSTFYENYTSAMDSKVETETLTANYPNKEALTTAIDGVDVEGRSEAKLNELLENEESNIRQKFATKLELDERSDSITAKFSATGGMNLLKNSLGFAEFEFWTTSPNPPTDDKLYTVSNNTLDILGFGSGFHFPTSTASRYAYQDVDVVAGEWYTLSWYIEKTSEMSDTNADGTSNSDGSFWVQVLETRESDGATLYTVSEKYVNSYVTSGYETKFVTFKPETNKIKVRLIGYKYAVATVTGLMLSIGDVALQWSLARGEVYNTNIRMDIKGIRVSQLNANRKEVGYTAITPDEFAGFYDSDGDGNFEKVFYLNGEETVTKKLRAKQEITMGTIKIIKVPQPEEWQSDMPYRVKDRVSVGKITYECTVGGTSGSVPPSHTSGTATDGTVTWKWISTSAYIGWAFVPITKD